MKTQEAGQETPPPEAGHENPQEAGQETLPPEKPNSIEIFYCL
jgi:hypothetical protein